MTLYGFHQRLGQVLGVLRKSREIWSSRPTIVMSDLNSHLLVFVTSERLKGQDKGTVTRSLMDAASQYFYRVDKSAKHVHQ